MAIYLWQDPVTFLYGSLKSGSSLVVVVIGVNMYWHVCAYVLMIPRSTARWIIIINDN